MLKVPLLLLDVLATVFVFQWLRDLRRRKGARNPPGPAGYPLLGNVFDLVVPELWKRARELGIAYGNLVHLQSFGQRIVITNSYDTALTLLEGRSLNYSDRPNSVMVNELQGWDWMFANQPYGEPWRKNRAPMQRFFEQSNLAQYEDVLQNESRKFLCNLLRTPENYEGHIRTAMASLIMMLTYGHEVVSADDPYVTLAEEGTAHLALALRPGAFLVDIVPWLKYIPKWLPGAGFQAIAAEGARFSHDLRYRPYADAKKNISAGTARRSFIIEQMEAIMGDEGRLSQEDEEIISANTGLCYIAGADTTVTSLMSFMSAMLVFQDVQKRAQEEIDRVVGEDRLPVLSDRPQLPYCDALYKEVLRWHPTIPLGVPRSSKEDDIFEGYFIPAKTTIIANHWAMLHDPVEYPNPDIFMPERFLLKPGERMPRDPSKIAFGFGRRICPGRHLAENTIFTMTIQVLAAFDICRVTDAEGKVIEPDIKQGLDGIINHTHRFDCVIKPRNKKVEELIVLE